MTIQRSTRRRGAVAAGLGLLLLAAPALAHHGWNSYGEEEFSLTGTVETVYLGNPHGVLRVRTEEGLWDVVLGPPGRNGRAGLVEGVVAPGDVVTAHGQPHTAPTRLEMKTERLVVDDQTFDIYPDRL